MLNTTSLPTDSLLDSLLVNETSDQTEDKNNLWAKLNLSQQYSVSSLGQFGYLLTYVRSTGANTLAILMRDGKLATINEAGIINIDPMIDQRH